MNLANTTVDTLAPSSAILLVEDEPVLRTSLARGLSRLSNVEVLAAANVDEAVSFLGTHAPSLLISDIDLPGASGLDLVAEFGRRDIDIPIILVTAYLKVYQDQIPAKPNVLVLEKPIPLDDLRTRVQELLGTARQSLHPPFNLIDCVQAACTSRRSVRIDIKLGDGSAHVTVCDGEVWAAEDDLGSGPGAFQRLAFVPDSEIHCSPMIGDFGPRNITVRWERLVLDLACPLDKHEQHGDLQPSVDVIPLPALPSASRTRASKSRARTLPGMPQVPPENLRDCEAMPSFDELWAFAVDALLRREYAVAARAFKAAGELRLGHPGILANLRRLKEMGFGVDDVGREDN
jgi:CheY-like chemotaxis protein